jgi:hypothetical protein
VPTVVFPTPPLPKKNVSRGGFERRFESRSVAPDLNVFNLLFGRFETRLDMLEESAMLFRNANGPLWKCKYPFWKSQQSAFEMQIG